MQQLIIEGGHPLYGEVEIAGAKNSALPILAATILTGGVSLLENIPRLTDVTTMLYLLEILGAQVHVNANTVKINTANINCVKAPYKLVKTMRASILVMGSLLGRFQMAQVALPGGCAIGLRPIDLHLEGFRHLGAQVEINAGYVKLQAKELKGADIYLPFPSVGATENLMMAATRATGISRIFNCACEPEVVDLANYLVKCGAKIDGAGTHTITIYGKTDFRDNVTYRIIPDRIEAGTYLCAGAITAGEVKVLGVIPQHLGATLDAISTMGMEITVYKDCVSLRSKRFIKPITLSTMPYPGFPTDMQAQCLTLACLSDGVSMITETIFENRFMHVAELLRMGADIKVEGNTAVIKGVKGLKSAEVMATDLRASAALILAGLAASGTTKISRIYHLDRGYECLESKLRKLGANIERVKEGR